MDQQDWWLFIPILLQDKRKYLDILHEYVEIHATIGDAENKLQIPDYVINHGVLNSQQLYDLLQESKVRAYSYQTRAKAKEIKEQ